MSAAKHVKLALAQLNSELDDSSTDLRRAPEYVDRAAQEDTDLIMLPFTPGRRVPIFDTRPGPVGVQICYDSPLP